MKKTLPTYTDSNVFAVFYLQQSKKVYDDAFRITRSIFLAEEVLQEVFLACWQKRDQLQNIKDIPAFLFILARNKSFKYLHKEKVELISREAYCQHYRQFYPPTDDPVQEREYHRLLDEAIKQLPIRRRQVFTLGKELSLKRREIALRLNMSELTVKAHMAQAMLDVKAFMKRKLVL